jgi:hypothetical protein
MNRRILLVAWLAFAVGSWNAESANGQASDSLSARMRPLGSGSAVDQYQSDRSQRFRETAFQNSGVPDSAVQLTQFEAPQLPPNAMTLPPNGAPGNATPLPPGATAPPIVATPGAGGFQTPAPITATPPRTLPPGSQGQFQPVPRAGVPSSSDLSPVVRPQLGGSGFATIDNCSNISPPSSYSALSGNGCATPVAYQCEPAYVGPVAAPPVPGVVVPAAYTPPKPLISLGQDRNPVVVGQGLIGQPVAYVPGQRFRNFVRYFFP